MKHSRLLVCTLLLAAICLAVPAGPDTSDQAAIAEAAKWIQTTPRIQKEYDYIMTCRLRLLFFWASRDDLGGGYIKIGQAADDPNFRLIQLLFGSDPAKAPRAINRWGAGTEVVRLDGKNMPESSAFVGFMKSSKGQSVSAMQRELSSEKSDGKYLFEAIVSRADRTQAISTTVPFYTNTDYTMNQLAYAQKLALDQLGNGQARKFRRLGGSVQPEFSKPSGFLSATEELMDRSLKGEAPPLSLGYVYNARRYRLTLQHFSNVSTKEVHLTLKSKQNVDRTYRNLKDLRFQIHNLESGEKTDFNVLVGTEGVLRGVPVQIEYQPNWWFQIVLNLKN